MIEASWTILYPHFIASVLLLFIAIYACHEAIKTRDEIKADISETNKILRGIRGDLETFLRKKK